MSSLAKPKCMVFCLDHILGVAYGTINKHGDFLYCHDNHIPSNQLKSNCLVKIARHENPMTEEHEQAMNHISLGVEVRYTKLSAGHVSANTRLARSHLLRKYCIHSEIETRINGYGVMVENKRFDS